MHTSRLLVLAAVALGGVLATPAAASAHDLRAKVTVADDVKVEAYFDDETPADSADVTVTDAGGREVAAGKTDERGVWSFRRPAPGEYTLVAKSTGHRATVKFPVGGEPDAPATYTVRRLNRWVGLAVGVVGLLGTSAAYWWFRRRRGSGLE